MSMPSWPDYLPEGYESRPEQQKFIEEAFGLLPQNKTYVVSAPCGVGKSLAALISTLPLAEEGKRLIVAYRTKNQLQIYLKELRAIAERRGRDHLPVSVISKQQMCPRFSGEKISYGALIQVCRVLRERSKAGREPGCEYYSKILKDQGRAKELALGWSKNYLSPIEAATRARKAKICPYEALKLIMPEAELFLGTYHYLFDPGIRREILRLLGADLSDCVAVIDEAHNLPAFARDLLSGKLPESSILRALGEVEEFGGEDAEKVREVLESIRDEVFPELSKGLKPGRLRRLDHGAAREVLKDAVGGVPEMAAELVHDYGESVWEARIERGERIYSYNHRVGEFLLSFLNADEPQHAHWVALDQEGEAYLELRSLDGRELTDEVLGRLHSSILMSGTLTPTEVYGGLVATNLEGMKFREFGSPFPAENRLIVVARDVSSRIEERTEQTYERWREYIEEVLRTNKGNVGVFFTSYDLMGHLLPRLETPRRRIVERRGTTRREVVQQLSRGSNKVLLGVVGGKLSEGIDYPGELLTCAVVVGFPYASWDDHQRALVEYMDSVFPGKGRLYGYLTPAVLRLLQTCGRVHRSEQDRGCVVILDKRVYYPYIRRKLPDYFQREMRVVSSPEECGRLVASFWEGKQENSENNLTENLPNIDTNLNPDI